MYLEEDGSPRLQAILDCFLQQPLDQQWQKNAAVTPEALLPLDVALSISKQAAEIFRLESNVVTVEGPVNVVGDIHGQFIDLLYLFELCGPLSPETSAEANAELPQALEPSSKSETGSESSSPSFPNSPVSDRASRDFVRSRSVDSCSESERRTPSDAPSSSSSKYRRPQKYQSEPMVLRKRSEERMEFTYRKRASVWVGKDSVQRVLQGIKETPSSAEGSTSAGNSATNGLASSASAHSIKAGKMYDEEPMYLFMGDYVDRGNFGCECILYLLALKIVFPRNIFMLRGNHETRCMTKRHFDDGTNFEAECVAKYGPELYESLMQCFDCLPLSAMVETGSRSYLTMHGGLSSKIKSIDDIMAIERFCEPPLKGPMCDLLWADPINEKMAEKWNESDYQEFLEFDFLPNPVRGCSCFYCFGAIQAFLEENKLSGILRAHECKEEGISFHFAKTRSRSFDFPLVTTVFSAPNYCGTYDNKGAVVRISDDDIEILRFGPASANPLQRRQDVDNLTDISIARFGEDIQLAEQNSEKFIHAAEKDACSEAHPGWQSLRKVTRIVTLLNKYRRAASVSGVALLTDSPGSIPVQSLRRAATTAKVDGLSSNASSDGGSVTEEARKTAERAQARVDLGGDVDGGERSSPTRPYVLQRDFSMALFRQQSEDSPSSSELPTPTAVGTMLQRRDTVADSVSTDDNRQLHILFDTIDRDGNGEISPAELQAFGQDLGCDPEVITRVQNLMDQDGDGMISFQEFVEYAGELLSSQEMRSPSKSQTVQ